MRASVAAKRMVVDVVTVTVPHIVGGVGLSLSQVSWSSELSLVADAYLRAGFIYFTTCL